MAKKITSVAWSASGVPPGISLGSSDGIFSGTPTQVGDYTVPVKVTTNYGSDQENVLIHVIEPAPGTYVVLFESNGGSSVASQTVVSGEKATQPSNPTKTGNTFAGWYDSALINQFNFNTAITSNITLYAKWNAITYTVTFNSNGGSAVASQTVNYGGKATQPSNPTKTGNTFAGWYSDSALTAQFDFNTVITVSNITLYAKWEVTAYTVTFESNGGSAVASQTVNSGGKATQPSNPTKIDYNFAGWYSDSALTSQFNFNTVITNNITLYAKWAVITYTVTFESNGGPEVEPQTVIAGETATRPSSYSRTGYTFDGWFTESELTNEFDFTTLITGNITLYAGWIIKYFLVTFNSQGGTKIASQKVNYNDTATRPDNPTKEGFGFLGWFLDKEGSSEFDFATPITEKTVLYAAWEAGIWTVTFISNGGSSVATQKVNSGEKATEPSKPTRTGYTFKGWYSDSNLATKFSFNDKITSDITLYAKWLVITYSVAFESNGGTAVSAQTVAYGDKATQPENPTKSDYAFGGWYTDSALTNQFNFNTAITKNTVLYAKWEEPEKTYTFVVRATNSVGSMEKEFSIKVVS